MSKTNIPSGSDQSVRLQSVGLFAANMQRKTGINRMSGPMSKQVDAEGNIRMVSSNQRPIVRVQDLSSKAGDEVTFDLINPMKCIPIMGGEIAVGNGAKMTFSSDRLRVNQARFPVSAGDQMSQQRSPHQLKQLSQVHAKSTLERFSDQASLVHLAGARGFHDNIEWCVPLASDPRFAGVMVNTVRAPTRNRHFMSTGSGIEQIVAGSNAITIATTDVFNTDVVDSIATWLDGMALPIPGVVFDNDEQASDSPLRVLMVSAEQYNSFVQSTNFRTLQASAMARGQQAKNNPVFMGDALLWRGILIIKMPKPIRFYAGNPINWCASTTSATETTTDLVPAGFGTTYAVDRAILLGGQALAEGFGKHNKSLGSYFTAEELTDFGDKYEYLVGEIAGRSKIRFLVDHGDSLQYTDNGVAVFDTAVRLAGV
jgi:N4-gp56 family major capsid protein